MQGSTFIYEDDPTKLLVIANDLGAVDDFSHVDMDGLLTLDFELVCANNKITWAAADPIVFDEGLVIFKVTEQGLDYVLSHPDAFEADQQEDLNLLRSFVASHGKDNVFEMATF